MKRDKYFIAVIDIGKTNKKMLVFSSDLKLEYRQSKEIGEKIEEGLLCDNAEATWDWILQSLKAVSSQYPIGVISTTTQGATVVHLDESGNLAFPVISYQYDPGKGALESFQAVCGDVKDLYLRTATPPLGQFLNVGPQLSWLKERYPKRFATIKHILFFPQYIGFLLTGRVAVELTSLGCHTYLYDFNRGGWSDVVNKLGLKDKLPARFSNPWDTLGTVKKEIQELTGLNENCQVGVGIHDSNASLLPYLLSAKKDFLLASTGTWCAFFHPGSNFHLSDSDLNKDTFYYLDAFGHLVRASRFKGGEEHDHYCNLIEKRFGRNVKKVKPDVEKLRKIFREGDCFVIPTLTPGAGQFPHSRSRIISEEKFYREPEEAYHLLNLSLVIQSYVAIKQVIGERTNISIFVEGGFRENAIYLSILSTLFPNQRVSSTNVKEATSLGAAICGKCALEDFDPCQISPNLVEINDKPIEKLNIERKLIQGYMEKFLIECKRIELK